MEETNLQKVKLTYPQAEGYADIHGLVSARGNTVSIRVGETIELSREEAMWAKTIFPFLEIFSLGEKPKDKERLEQDLSVSRPAKEIEKELKQAKKELKAAKVEEQTALVSAEETEEEVELDLENLESLSRGDLMRIASSLGIKHMQSSANLIKQIREHFN